MKNIKNFITESKGTERPVNEAKMKKSGRYFVKKVYFTNAKDDYKEGVSDDESYYTVDYQFYGDTVTEVIKTVLNFFDFDKKNARIYENDVVCDALVNKDNLVYTEEDDEYEMWKKGEFDLWNSEMRFEIFEIKQVGHDELVKETGLESYD